MRKTVVLCSLAAALAFSVAFFAVKRTQTRVPAPGPSGYRLVKTVLVPGDEGRDYVTVDSDARRVYISHATHVVVMNADTYAIEELTQEANHEPKTSPGLSHPDSDDAGETSKPN